MMGPFARTEMLEWVRLFCIFDRESSTHTQHNTDTIGTTQ